MCICLYFFVVISCNLKRKLIIKPYPFKIQSCRVNNKQGKPYSQFIHHLINKIKCQQWGKYLIPKKNPNSNRYSKSTTFIPNFFVILRSSLGHSFVDSNHGLKIMSQVSLVMMLSQLQVASCSEGVWLWRILQPGDLAKLTNSKDR